MAKYGLDISEHNEVTLSSYNTWDKIKESKFKDFIIIRRGYGVTPSSDSCYFQWYKNAKRIGIDDISSYWFSYALTADEAKIEARSYIKMTEQDGLALNAMIMDLEDNGKFQANGITLTSKFINQQIEAFIGELKKAGLNSAVYTSQWICQDLLDWDLIKELGCGVWNAAYSQEDAIRGWMFQYTDSEYIDGIGPFDANIMY